MKHERVRGWLRFLIIPAGIFCFSAVSAGALSAQALEQEPVSISVVVANPSKEKTHVIPVKIDLPAEVTPDDILEMGELNIHYDDQKSVYFLFNEEVTLKPQETRIFNVLVRNVWLIPQPELDELKTYTDLLLGRLQGSEYHDAGKRLADIIYQKLQGIDLKQRDETLGQKQRIGIYRINRKAVTEIKEHLEKMEKILSFQGGPPVPDMLQESDLKSDAPSTKTTWLIILSILIFLGLLGAQFFFTWHRRAEAEKEYQNMQKQKLPGASSQSGGYGPGAGERERKSA